MLISVLLNLAAFGLAAGLPALDLLSSGAPAIFAVSVVAGLVALVTRAWLLALGAVLGGVAPPAVAIGLELAAMIRPPAPATPNSLKIVSFNIWSANDNPAALTSFILSERPDVLLLQEAARNDHPLFFEALETVYPTIVTNYPHCTTAIATTLALVEHNPSQTCANTIARLRLPATLGGEEIVVASTHLPNARHGEAGSDADVLMSRMSAWRHAIVGGDFNATPWSWVIRRFDAVPGFERWTRALPTWPAPAAAKEGIPSLVAFLPIDHIFSTDDWQLIRVRRGPDLGSDHYPIIVELARPPETAGR